MKARRRGFHINEAPQTLIDAVTITRHLRLRYLWVDSLCICQNDAEDWARESSRMADVYSDAYIVIAASRSDDCNKGCFHIRQDRPTVVIDLPNGFNAVHATTLFLTDQDVLFTFEDNFRGEPLSTRGWALQERVLARRIVHYNSRQLYFECAAGILAEDGSYSLRRLSDLSELRCPESYPRDITKVPIAWSSLLDSFGSRKLTKPTDKLPAISGLARLVQKRTNAEYVAGLWSNSMIKGIAWLGDRRGAPVSRDEYVAPSWSWASYDGTPSFSAYSPPAISEVLDWHVDLKHVENPFGEVTSAWIRIRGPVARLRPSPPEKCGHEARFYRAGLAPRLSVCTPYSDNDEGPVLDLDHSDTQESGEWRGWDLQVLLLFHYVYGGSNAGGTGDSDSSDPNQLTLGLAIRSEGAGQTGKMQRVGTAVMKTKEAFKIKRDESNWRTIVLV